MTTADTSPAFFERLYQGAEDPWDFNASPYETARYRRTIEALEGRYFDSVYEPGCSIGALTERLASCCRELLACDASPTAAGRASARLRRFAHVQVEQAVLPQDLPNRSFDLIVLSEMGYYFDRATLVRLIDELVNRLRPNGVLLGCHWLGHSEDHVLSGHDVHAVINQSRLRPASIRPSSGDGYMLDIWMKPDA